MSKKLTYLYSFILLLFAVPQVAYAQFVNLVENASFEEDEVIFNDEDYEHWWTWGWAEGLDSTVEFDESRYVDGKRSLRVDPMGGTNWWFMVDYSPIPCEVGTTYTASVWVVAEEPRPFWIQFKATDNSTQWGQTQFELTTEWAEYTITSVAQSAEMKIELYCSGSEVTLWMDYVFVYEGEYIPGFIPGGAVNATAPSPADGAIDVAREITLSWTPGKYAEKHELYFGTDINDVNNADVNDTTGIYKGSSELDVTSYTPTEMPLQWGQTYYWRVDEVNDPDPNSPWMGDVWSFTIINHIVLEDFEDYNDYSPNEVWNTWIDGYGDPTNGSSAGYPNPDFILGEHYLEDDIVHGGDWSLPLFYSNDSSGLSEVTRTLTSPLRDWTQEDFITLTLFYIGNLGNAAEPMYVALNGDAVVTNVDPSAALESDWTQWDILLQDFVDMGVDLTNVDTLSIGFGDKTNPTPGGGDGRVFIDDIRLYLSPPIPSIEPESEPEPVDPGTDNLVASYSFENNVQDGSGNGLNGSIVGNPGFVEGITGMGLMFDGTDNYVDLGSNEAFDITEQITLSVWVNTNDCGNGQHNPYVSKGDHAYAIKHSDGNQMQFFIFDGDWLLANARVDDSFNGVWHHVAGTYDGMELKLYVDGRIAATTEHEGSIEIQPHHVNIARNSEEVHRTYDGIIDEVRIYDRALSWAEILFIVNK